MPFNTRRWAASVCRFVAHAERAVIYGSGRVLVHAAHTLVCSPLRVDLVAVGVRHVSTAVALAVGEEAGVNFACSDCIKLGSRQAAQ